MIYLQHILYNGKDDFPVLCIVPKRVQKINLKKTSGNKRKVSNVKDCLNVLCRWEIVEKGQQEKF